MTDESGTTQKVQEVAEEAQAKAQEATVKAGNVVRDQVDSRTSDLGQRATGTSSDLRSVGEKLRDEGQDAPAQLAEKAAEQAERIGNYLTEADADSLVNDLEDFGRRQPLAVLAGGVILGVVAARFLKASSGRRYESRVSGSPTGRSLTASNAAPSQTSQRPAPSVQRPPAEVDLPRQADPAFR